MVPSFKRQILEIPARNKTKQFNIIWQVNVQKERSIFEGSAISLVRQVSPNLTIPPSQTRLLPLFPFCSAGLDYRLDYQLLFKKRVLAPTPNSHRLDSSEWRKSRYLWKETQNCENYSTCFDQFDLETRRWSQKVNNNFRTVSSGKFRSINNGHKNISQGEFYSRGNTVPS